MRPRRSAAGHPGPITNFPLLRLVMGALAPPERQRVLTAMRGYASFIADCDARGKLARSRTPIGGLLPGCGQDTARAARKPKSRRLFSASRLAVPKAAPGRCSTRLRGFLSQTISVRGIGSTGRSTRGRRALGKFRRRSAWEFVPETATSQVGAWREFLRETLEKPLGLSIRDRVWRGRERIHQRGFIAPWPWPPRKDGTLSATGPPSAPLMNAEDENVKL